MGSRKSTQTTTTNQTGQQQTTTPGTEYSTALLPYGEQLAQNVMGQQSFTGDRVAAPQDLGAGNYAAQWGPTPTTFTPQLTATERPMEGMLTHVDPNAQEAIAAGMGAAQTNQAPIAGLVQQGYDQLSQFLSGDQNPHLQTLLNQLGARSEQESARQFNQLAGLMGSQGAYGGTDQNRWNLDIADRQQQAHDEAVARLLYDEYMNRQQFAAAAPGAIAGYAGVSTLPAEQFARYGGMRQENLQAAAATGDQNAQRLLNNLNNAMRLNDENAIRAAENEIQQWQAAYQTETARVADVQGRATAQQAAEQAAMDNAYLRWLTQQELLGSQVGNIGSLIGYGGLVPGSTTYSSQQGTSTTESKQKASPWEIAAGLGGAALQMFAPGGFFSGSASKLGMPGLPVAQYPQMPTWQTPPINPMPNFNFMPRTGYGG